MIYRLYGAKPLSVPMLAYHQLDPRQYTSVNYVVFKMAISFLLNVLIHQLDAWPIS